ncbi:MAG TPA: PilZ domain-containing protein [Candidatus Acidoferrum sp.]|nr:PilZ domain-containing protein [Candidatus Acidoferrum sp.]
MMQENDQGIAYLMALKRGAAAAPAPARENNHEAAAGIEPASQNSYSGAEKRRSPRYKCEGSVEMCEVSCEVRTWATFTDISVHGCYVEAQATYPVGSVLRLKLEANGQRVEATGNVRVSYPYLGMGIAFVKITGENEARLRNMLASLSRPSVIIGPGLPSTLPARGPLEAVPAIPDPTAAIQALIDFFESQQMLMREDFLRVLRQSQPKD